MCSDEDVKNTVVDFIMGSQYSEISLDEDPCIFPDCGHFYTCSNMDGVMSMGDHYTLDPEGRPIALAGPSEPFSLDGTKVEVCPTCRGSLRSISRYGRIVRRALLDESTKKFIIWANSQYTELGLQLVGKLDQLSKIAETTDSVKNLTLEHAAETILPESRTRLLMKANAIIGDKRYSGLIGLWQQITRFGKLAAVGEQPISKVANFVRFASQSNSMHFDSEVLQVKGTLQAICLQLQCELAILLDFVRLRQTRHRLQSVYIAGVKQQLRDCEALITLATERDYPKERVHGHLFYVKFCIVQRGFSARATTEENPAVTETAKHPASETGDAASEHITAAEDLVTHVKSLASLRSEVESTRTMLNNGTFYSQVSKEEMLAIYAAMSTEFRGTGHWYNCVNGHPFTVGECGMPMEEARCPECGEGVGGRDHAPTAGVQRATEMDDLARELGQTRL